MNVRRLLLPCALLGLGALSNAQITGLPKLSPYAKLDQTVGITGFSVTYHRPTVKGRTIWGGLVPYGQVWRAGANENTVFEVTHPIRVGDKDLPAGKYGLHLIPNSDKDATLILSKNAGLWGSFGYDAKDDALRVEVKLVESPFCESMGFDFRDVSDSSATLALSWADRTVAIPITVDTPRFVVEIIKRQIAAQPTAQTYSDAADYSLYHSVDLEDGLIWIDKALAMQSSPMSLGVKAGILFELKRLDEAEEVLGMALLGDQANQLSNLGLRFLNTNKYALAARIYEGITVKNPRSWYAWYSLGEAHRQMGQRDQALESYLRAIDLVQSDADAARVEAGLVAAETL